MADKNGTASAKSSIRPSMAVTPANTKTLRSKFEQLQVVANTGNASRTRRGHTLGAKDDIPNELKFKNPVLETSKSSSVIGSKVTSPSTKSTLNTSQKMLPVPAKLVSAPVKATKILIPPKVEDLSTLEVDSTAMRSKPKQKPKPDPTRQTTLFTKPPVQEEPKPEVKVIEKVSPSQSNNTSYNGLLSDIIDKWKIQYEELEFDQLVSAGSAGEVYMGYYFGTPVAIKKLFSLPPDQKHLVAREFSMLQGVNHPNIVQFLGICDHESGIYLITEYVEHGDLFDLLIFGGEPVTWKTKIKIALQVAQAVYYLHSRKIIHRDLKSQNVLIGENMKVKLCDLGLATVTDFEKRMTVCGTNEWMAPEILLQDNYDDKVDVFSFGIVLTELVTCQPPKKREIQKMLAFDTEGFLRDLPEGCPQEFAQLIVDCCKFKPDERPPFKDIVTRLRKLQNDILDDD